MTKKNFHSAGSEKKALALLDRSLARCIPGVPAISNCALTVERTLTPAKDVHAEPMQRRINNEKTRAGNPWFIPRAN